VEEPDLTRWIGLTSVKPTAEDPWDGGLSEANRSRGDAWVLGAYIQRLRAVRECSDGDFLDVARILGGRSTQWYCNRDDWLTRVAAGGAAELAARGGAWAREPKVQNFGCCVVARERSDGDVLGGAR
jgi:hypothetical protein